VDDRPEASQVVVRLVAVAAGIVIAAGITLGVLGGAWEHRYAERILPGVTVGGVDVGGLDRAAATARVELAARDVLERPVRVRAGTEQWTRPAQALGRQAGVAEAVETALAIGRRGNFIERVAERLRLWRGSLNTPLAYDTDIVKARLAIAEFAGHVSAVPRDAAFTVVDGRLIVTEPEHDGVRVDIDASVARLVEGLRQPEAIVDLVSERAPAVLTSDMVARIADPVARFTTAYPYNRDRVHNIHLAAAAFRGVVLPPGAVLSYNRAVGPRVESRGYRKAPVLINNELVPGDGGGICQVSSTLFNAGLLADFKIEARVNHSRPVPYLAAGRDATVVYGVIDLRMRNTTGHTVIVWSSVTARSVTITFYGLPQPGREIDILVTDHRVLPAPDKTVVKYDDDLPAGQVKEERARTGLRARTFRVVRQDGVETRRDFVASNYYQPTPRTIRIGTGGAPAPAKRAQIP
jgi:vancomycin resistance protein YoaR